MANSRVRYTRRKIDAWVVYDELPPPVRQALQEGPNQWDAVGVRRYLNRYSKSMPRRDAIAQTVKLIYSAHAQEIKKAAPWRGSSPHLRAEATMQLSNRERY